MAWQRVGTLKSCSASSRLCIEMNSSSMPPTRAVPLSLSLASAGADGVPEGWRVRGADVLGADGAAAAG